MRRLPGLFSVILLCAACSEPPNKEMNRAQGAIDAARAAGAEQYATESLSAATAALQQSRDAVDQRDYRLALSRALDAVDRAEEAAKQAADNKAKIRSEAETAVNTTNVQLQQLSALLKEAAAAHVPASALARARAAETDTTAALQKARAALRASNYIDATSAMKGKSAEIAAQIREIEAALDARGVRSPKRKR